MKSLWRLLSPMYRQRRDGLLVALLLTIVALLAGVGLLGVSGWFLTGAALAGAGAAFNLFAPSALVRGFSFIRILARYGERLTGHDATLKLLADLRGNIFRRLLKLDPAQLARYRDGDLVARLTGDVDALDTVYLFAIAPIITALCVGGILVAVLGAWVPAAALVLLAGILLATLVVPAWLARSARRPGAVVQQTSAALRDGVLEAVQAHADLLALDAAEEARKAFAANCLEAAVARERQAAIGSAGQLVLQAVAGLCVVAVLYFGIEPLRGGTVSGPVLAGMVLAVLGVFEVIGPIMRGASRLGAAAAAARRIEALAEEPPQIVDPAHPVALPQHGEVVFDKVFYAYGKAGDERGGDVLRGLDLRLRPGELVAVVGASGAGKSTLLSLLLRLADPRQGTVSFGGVALSDTRQEEVHARVALLSQNEPVFLGTIRSNLQIGAPEADDDTLWRALDDARLGDFVRALPDGLDTWTGETGRTLSAGQARRLCLARALLSPAQVLALDEPTQGLDAEAERAFLSDLASAARGRAVLLVTHARLPEGAADRVLELRDGVLLPLMPR